MFYIIETKYVGPNSYASEYVDVDKIEISTTPALTKSSHEVRTEGWCGTTNDLAEYAHGEYATLEEARAAITDIFGDVRDTDSVGDPIVSDDKDIVETYKPGKYLPMSGEEVAFWAYDMVFDEITADTTDERIAELGRMAEAEANGFRCTLCGHAEAFMYERRQDLLDQNS